MPTPNLDRLVSEGLRFTDGRTTMATALQRAGYKTVVVGEWHLGLGAEKLDKSRRCCPADRGLQANAFRIFRRMI